MFIFSVNRVKRLVRVYSQANIAMSVFEQQTHLTFCRTTVCSHWLARETSYLAMLIGLTFQSPLISSVCVGVSAAVRSNINTVASQRNRPPPTLLLFIHPAFLDGFNIEASLCCCCHCIYRDVLQRFCLGIFFYLLFVFSLSFPIAAKM